MSDFYLTNNPLYGVCVKHQLFLISLNESDRDEVRKLIRDLENGNVFVSDLDNCGIVDQVLLRSMSPLSERELKVLF